MEGFILFAVDIMSHGCYDILGDEKCSAVVDLLIIRDSESQSADIGMQCFFHFSGRHHFRELALAIDLVLVRVVLLQLV